MRENRRKAERILMRVDVEMEWDSRSRQCRITNLSTGGCFVESLDPIKAGELIKLMLPLVFGQWLQVSGEIIHLYSTGFGVRFVELTSKEKILLQEFILRHGKNPSAQPVTATRQKLVKTNKLVEKESDKTNNADKKSGEFERFIDDLMKDID